MDSARPTSEPDGERFRPTLGRDLHARHRLHRATFAGRDGGPLAGVVPGRSLGHLARVATVFSRSVGLSQAARWRVQRSHAAAGRWADVVRPPLEYWPFLETDEADGVVGGEVGGGMASELGWRAVATSDAGAVARSTARPTPMRRRSQPVRRSPEVMTPGVPSLTGPADGRQAGSPPRSVDKLELLRQALAQRPDLTGGRSMAATSPGDAAVAVAEVPTAPRTAAETWTTDGEVPVSTRGLPIVARRSGRTWAGPDTAPGRIAGAAAPDATGAVDLGRIDGSSALRRSLADTSGGGPTGSGARGPRPSKLDLLRDALIAAGKLPGDHGSGGGGPGGDGGAPGPGGAASSGAPGSPASAPPVEGTPPARAGRTATSALRRATSLPAVTERVAPPAHGRETSGSFAVAVPVTPADAAVTDAAVTDAAVPDAAATDAALTDGRTMTRATRLVSTTPASDPARAPRALIDAPAIERWWGGVEPIDAPDVLDMPVRPATGDVQRWDGGETVEAPGDGAGTPISDGPAGRPRPLPRALRRRPAAATTTTAPDGSTAPAVQSGSTGQRSTARVAPSTGRVTQRVPRTEATANEATANAGPANAGPATAGPADAGQVNEATATAGPADAGQVKVGPADAGPEPTVRRSLSTIGPLAAAGALDTAAATGLAGLQEAGVVERPEAPPLPDPAVTPRDPAVRAAPDPTGAGTAVSGPAMVGPHAVVPRTTGSPTTDLPPAGPPATDLRGPGRDMAAMVHRAEAPYVGEVTSGTWQARAASVEPRRVTRPGPGEQTVGRTTRLTDRPSIVRGERALRRSRDGRRLVRAGVTPAPTGDAGLGTSAGRGVAGRGVAGRGVAGRGVSGERESAQPFLDAAGLTVGPLTSMTGSMTDAPVRRWVDSGTHEPVDGIVSDAGPGTWSVRATPGQVVRHSPIARRRARPRSRPATDEAAGGVTAGVTAGLRGTVTGRVDAAGELGGRDVVPVADQAGVGLPRVLRRVVAPEVVHDVSVRDVPLHDAPVRDAPVRDVPVRDVPVRDVPVHDVAVPGVAAPGVAPKAGAPDVSRSDVSRSDDGATGGPAVGVVASAQEPLPAHAPIADRFLHELGRHRRERPVELPAAFRPMAEIIAPERRPLLATGEASRRALAAVGKVAATTGDVIHLAEAPTTSTPRAELHAIIAHELTHVASPSAAPRFFADDRDSPEERRAHAVGELIRRSPVAPRLAAPAAIARTSASTSGEGPMTTSTMISSGGSSGGSTTTVRAADLAASLTGTAPTIRRSPADPLSPAAREAAPAESFAASRRPDGEVIRRELTTTGDSPTSASGTSDDTTGVVTAANFHAYLREHFDLIVDLLEQRIITQLERRGGRYRGDF